MRTRFRLLAGLLLLTSGSGPAMSAADARDSYLRACSICHMENGEGVESAFPPLDARLARWAGSEDGRRYLVSVITRGLFGSIDVNGVRYAGAMPPMTHLDSETIAAILNHVLQELAGADPKLAFSAEEVAGIRSRGAGQPSLSLRPE